MNKKDSFRSKPAYLIVSFVAGIMVTALTIMLWQWNSPLRLDTSSDTAFRSSLEKMEASLEGNPKKKRQLKAVVAIHTIKGLGYRGNNFVKDIFGPLDGMTCDEMIQSTKLPDLDQANLNNDRKSGRSPSAEPREVKLSSIVMWPLIGSGLLFCCLFGLSCGERRQFILFNTLTFASLAIFGAATFFSFPLSAEPAKYQIQLWALVPGLVSLIAFVITKGVFSNDYVQANDSQSLEPKANTTPDETPATQPQTETDSSPIPFNSSIQTSNKQNRKATSGNSPLPVVVCPHCQMRMTPMANGNCPSCDTLYREPIV